MIYELGERLSAYVYQNGKTYVGTVAKMWAAGEARDPDEVCRYYDVTPEYRIFGILCKPSVKDWVVLRKSDGKHFGFCPQANGKYQQVSRLL